jgi:D-xylose 1-dehydrogenase
MANNQRFAIYPSLAERLVVISGGATGIGASMAEAFALQGSQVIILDILDDAANELSQGLVERGAARRPIFHHCDVTDIDNDLKPTAAKILSQFPKVDALINNAAQDARLPTLEITSEQWDQGLAVNLRHVFFLTQALMPGLVAAGSASVINMGSITWAIPGTGLVPYIAAKAAIVGITKTLAHEFGPQGVRVNSIMPGAIATERQKRDVITPEYEAHVLGRQALKKILQPEEVSRLALWLIADDSSGVTNQSIVVDAGWI